MATPVRCAIYTRVSTGKQRDQGISLVEQRARLEQYVRSKGWALDGIYQDAGFSAKSLQRPEMQRLLADAAAWKFDRIVAFDLSRISRDVHDWSGLRKLLRTHGVSVVLLNEDTDDTPAGRMMQNVIASIRQYEREALAARMKALAEFKQSNRQPWSKIPFGFKLARDGRLTPIPHELATIRRVVDLRKHQGTFREIAQMVKEDSKPPMHPMAVSRIVRYAQPGGLYERLGLRVTA
jgi:site-specific DNA recombinase